jgi:hypothetical protein
MWWVGPEGEVTLQRSTRGGDQGHRGEVTGGLHARPDGPAHDQGDGEQPEGPDEPGGHRGERQREGDEAEAEQGERETHARVQGRGGGEGDAAHDGEGHRGEGDEGGAQRTQRNPRGDGSHDPERDAHPEDGAGDGEGDRGESHPVREG